MPEGFFVTGTDTNVGKTVLSALLCSALPAMYWKPIQTGAVEGTDRQTVLAASGIGESNALPETYIFDDPVSPHLAAQRAGSEISLETIRFPQTCGARLIAEGAGGVMVPINSHEFMTDLIRHLGLPVILAARSTLGTINHTLLSLRCLASAGARVTGVVLIGPENRDNRQAIERYGKTRVVGEIPPLETIHRQALRDVFARHFTREAFA
ncbi:MAG TPA: dethiobiotin synthase [Candidatus Angelobacter sp.]|nr:dethiobiotin synthase [Candidatus Angelobacter sp.]